MNTRSRQAGADYVAARQGWVEADAALRRIMIEYFPARGAPQSTRPLDEDVWGTITEICERLDTARQRLFAARHAIPN